MDDETRDVCAVFASRPSV